MIQNVVACAIKINTVIHIQKAEVNYWRDQWPWVQKALM